MLPQDGITTLIWTVSFCKTDGKANLQLQAMTDKLTKLEISLKSFPKKVMLNNPFTSLEKHDVSRLQMAELKKFWAHKKSQWTQL